MKNYYYATALTGTIGANLVESRWIDYDHWTVPDDPKIHILGAGRRVRSGYPTTW